MFGIQLEQWRVCTNYQHNKATLGMRVKQDFISWNCWGVWQQASLFCFFIFLAKASCFHYKSKDDSFKLHHVDVQRQIGGSDCALFAMAFATALCESIDPYLLNCDQASMRSHLIQCFENRKITQFLETSHAKRAARKRIINRKSVNVFCLCRLPWDRSDCVRGTLVQCNSCKKWYHEACMNIDKQTINAPHLKYTCHVCLDI